MKKILLFVLCIGSMSLSYAQVRLQKIDNTSKFVEVEQHATDAEIYAAFGTPLNVEAHQDEAADGYIKNFIYNDLRISTVDQIVYDFALESKRYEVLIDNRYKIKIGDSAAVILATIPLSEYLRRNSENMVQLFWKIVNTDMYSDSSLILTLDTAGRIINIQWYSPV